MAPTRSASLGEVLRGFAVDVLVVHRWSRPLPKDVVALPPLGVLRAHESLLPRWRGTCPVEWAIRAGDRTFGVTVHRVDGVGVGTGPVLAYRELPLPDDTDRVALDRHLRDAVEDSMREALDSVAAGERGVPQDESRATYAGPLEGGAFDIADLTGPRKALHDLVRCHRYTGLAGPRVTIEGNDFYVSATSTRPVSGRRIDCADGPLWITRAVSDSDAAESLSPSPERTELEVSGEVDVTAPERTWSTRDECNLAERITDAVYDVVTTDVSRLGLVEHPTRLWAIAEFAGAQTARRLGVDAPALTPSGRQG